MTTALEGLPDDPLGLRAAVLAMRAELEAERAERRRIEDQNGKRCSGGTTFSVARFLGI